jgi:hypothetical protein
MKKVLIVISIIFISIGLYVIYNNPDTTPVYTSTIGEDSMAWMENELLHPDDEIPEQYRGKKEWIPMKVVECIETNDGNFEITFVNDYYIVSDTPAKIGDTDRCWENTWYFSKEYPTSDSIVFENPYKK